ncbi:FAD-binding oxidoreductase [Altericroceibacterium spongiae]|uniref:FAD-binding oxidoreductase n=1 Tax=Altericroceibacterium spongiae TaxID=2320269 RepID=A0A420EE31_9SPHN|nr:FAD-binding oxidoreductase [Altericroceibacterium spongiae]RKF18914.1 FAD-binding oxidoreductase [Altericroceibacterium spongiae]
MMKVFVVGGGVVGLCSAVALAEAGHDICLWDAESHQKGAQTGPASWGNAGHIATEQVTPLASPDSLLTFARRLFCLGGPLAMPPGQFAAWGPFALRFLAASRPASYRAGSTALHALATQALPAWQRLAARLREPGLLREQGHYVTWESGRSATAGRAHWARSDIGPCTIAPITSEECTQLQTISPSGIADGIRFSGTAQIADLDMLRETLLHRLTALGGTVRHEAAELSLAHGNVLVNGVSADQVLVSAGLGSKALLEALGHTVPIIAERGYHIRAQAERWPADMPPIVFEDRNMIVTRYKDSVQAASFVEFSASDAPADPRKWERLESHVAELGLTVSPPYRRWMGCRPTLPDYLPAIGRSRRARNLLYAFGHQHLGLTLAAITADLVVNLADGTQPKVDMTAFDIDRFGGKGIER